MGQGVHGVGAVELQDQDGAMHALHQGMGRTPKGPHAWGPAARNPTSDCQQQRHPDPSCCGGCHGRLLLTS